MLGRGRGKYGIGGQEKPSEPPPGAGGRLLSRVAVTDSMFVVLSLCLVSFLPWGPHAHTPTKQSFSVVSRRGPQGPSSRMGVGRWCHGHTSPPSQEPPQNRAQLGPQALPESRHPGWLPLSSSSLLIHQTVEGWTTRQWQGTRPEDTTLAAGGLGQMRGPHPLSLPLPMENLAARHGIPSLPCSRGRSRALWEL